MEQEDQKEEIKGLSKLGRWLSGAGTGLKWIENTTEVIKNIAEMIRDVDLALRLTGKAKRETCKYINTRGYCINPHYANPDIPKIWAENKIKTISRGGKHYPMPYSLWCATCPFYEKAEDDQENEMRSE